MASVDQKIFFTALGFLAVILKDTPKDKQPQRAAAMAGLIEEFCMSVVPEAFEKDERVEQLSVEQRMAFLIAGLIEMHGECEPDDLKDRGFTPDEITKHWKMAYALACVSLNDKPSNS